MDDRLPSSQNSDLGVELDKGVFTDLSYSMPLSHFCYIEHLEIVSSLLGS